MAVFQTRCTAAMAAPMSWRRLVYSVYSPAIAGVFTRISDRLFRARDRRGGSIFEFEFVFTIVPNHLCLASLTLSPNCST
uniref:Uncharacterized protein n=1 Tax=Amphilophus citrinellus TaxID=61819 RepID=A0A3Q0QT89_AMPCI